MQQGRLSPLNHLQGGSNYMSAEIRQKPVPVSDENYDQVLKKFSSNPLVFLKDAGDLRHLINIMATRWLSPPTPRSIIDDIVYCFGVTPHPTKVIQKDACDEFLPGGRAGYDKHKHKKKNKLNENFERRKTYYGVDALRYGRMSLEVRAVTNMISFFTTKQQDLTVLQKISSSTVTLVLDLLSFILQRIQLKHEAFIHYIKCEEIRIQSQETLERFMQYKNKFGNRATEDALHKISENATNNYYETHKPNEYRDKNELDNVDSDSDLEDDLLDATHFNGLSNKITKIYSNSNQKPIVQAMQYLFEVAKSKQLQREGLNLLKKRIIPVKTIAVHNETQEPLCKKCGQVESKHPTKIGHRCADHAFEFDFVDDTIEKDDTMSWEPHTSIKDFVYTEINSTRSELFNRTLELRSKLVKELENTVGETWLPVLKRNKSDELYGPTVSFQNGIFFCKSCEFYTYEQFKEKQKQGLYKHVVAHFVDEWFFWDRYAAGLRGKPMLDMPGYKDRPKQFQYENCMLNEVCTKCNTTKQYHKKKCRHPTWTHVKCSNCKQNVKKTEMHKKNCCCDNPMFYTVDYVKGLANVPTPFMNSVLKTQFEKFKDYNTYLGIEFWFWVLAGHFVNRKPKDPSMDWAIIPSIYGLAGTGKSIFMDSMSMLIPKEKIGIISADAQKDFGFQNLISKDGKTQKKYVILETDNFQLACAIFKSLACGEKVTFNRKNETVWEGQWHETGFIIGYVQRNTSLDHNCLFDCMLIFV